MAKPTLSEISKLFKTDDKPTDFHYYGTVVSADVENRTYEVSINRDENITVEAARLVGAHVGDTVMVTVMANGYATVTGRVGGDTDASDAQRKADSASDTADKAQAKAVSALSKATEADQLANQAKQLANQAERNASRSADAAFNSEQSAQESAESAARSATAADTAERNAASSKTAAETAQQNAADSQTAAEAARDRATVAEGYADTAQKQAAKAEKEASAANSYAVGALDSLSTTQDIMGVLSWVEESIKYVWDYPPTVEDKEYDPSKQYYTVIGKRVIGPIETDYDKYYVLNSESEPASKTGNIVTFDSDLDNFPLNSLTATINPKQDLHGYDKPWVGGAGKNLCPNIGWVQGQLTNNGNIANYKYSISSDFIFLDAGTYVASRSYSDGSAGSLAYHSYNTEKVWQADSGWQTNPFTITVTEPRYIRFTTRKNTSDALLPSDVDSAVKIQLEKGSTATSWTPYSNICPISGLDEVSTYVSPTISAEDGTTYTTDLGRTVYGGSLDVVNGVLTVDRAMVDLGTLTWNYNASWGGYPAFYCSVAPTGIKVPSTSSTLIGAICSQYTEVKRDYLYSNNVTAFCIPSDGKVSVRDSRYTSASDFKTAMNGVRLVYELATPRTIQLTPTQINTLLGENNVWADSGDVTVEYWDGPVGYVTPTSSFDPTETYYTVKGSPVKIDESKQEEHGKGLYYVHDLTNAKEAMADFIKAHLALNDEGLYVLKGPNDWRVLVANDGVYIIDPQGRKVASYGEDIAFDSQRPHTIGNENQYVKYYQDEEDAEYKISINADSITLGSSTIPTTEEMMRQASDAQEQAEANAKEYADNALESFTSKFTVSPENISSEVVAIQDGETLVSRINQLPDSVKIEAKNVEIVDRYESYIELAADEANPYILLGKRDNNAMLLRITNERMGFEVNSEEVAYLAPDALHVQKQISFGDFIMKQRENGHLSIIRVTRGG